ncbi:MAG: pyrimidine 5'-nucleotidase [Pseudomonadota bacterium]
MSTPKPHTELHAFADVDTWVFDLDNTLYPRKCDLFAQMDRRMTAYVQKTLDLPFDDARKVQKAYYRDYGTTLRGLMMVNHIDPLDYLEFVHDIDYSPVEPAPQLRAAIEKLPGRKLIFTNGDEPHARRTTDRLGISDLFHDVFDIVAADLLPKPDRATYERFIDRTGTKPEKAAMFEDIARNLLVPHAMQMRTVLVSDVPEGEALRLEFERAHEDDDHIHHRTDDLTSFLEKVHLAL